MIYMFFHIKKLIIYDVIPVRLASPRCLGKLELWKHIAQPATENEYIALVLK